MTRLFQHYVIERAQVGVAIVKIYALRCGTCSKDFHTDVEPQFCPCCGTEVSCILPFGAKSSLSVATIARRPA